MKKPLSTEQVCKLFNISQNGVYRAVKRGELQAIKICGRFRFPAEAIETMLKGGSRGGSENTRQAAEA